jgi:hypothetical protein
VRAAEAEFQVTPGRGRDPKSGCRQGRIRFRSLVTDHRRPVSSFAPKSLKKPCNRDRAATRGNVPFHGDGFERHSLPDDQERAAPTEVPSKEEKVGVEGVPNQPNQNPNLFPLPDVCHGNDRDQFEIISKTAMTVQDLASVPEKTLITTTDTLAAPGLLYARNARSIHGNRSGLYDLATEVYPPPLYCRAGGRLKLKSSPQTHLTAIFSMWTAIPLCVDGVACLIQHILNGRFYGYDCHLEGAR